MSDEESSSDNDATNANNNTHLLRHFRDQWKAELADKSQTDAGAKGSTADVRKSTASNKPNSGGPTAASIEHSTDAEIAEATELFEQGSRMEDLGKVFEAMQFYRRAMQIVPNIEMHVYQSEKGAAEEEEAAAAEKQAAQRTLPKAAKTTTTTDADEDLSDVDLLARFGECVRQAGTFIQRAHPSGRPHRAAGGVIETSSASTFHIGDLPAELLLYILRWVVSVDLDTRSLDRCALVSRGLYIYARDPEIWRLACQRIWGAAEAHLVRPAFRSWRHMYTHKARVHLNGVYVSKTSYFRYGENSFQDQFYRPMHLIEYYRYVRFFADGHAYMLTTPQAPGAMLARLIAAPRQQQRADLLCGTYSIETGGTVRLQLRRQRASGAEAGGGGRRRRASRVGNGAAASAGNCEADRNLAYEVHFRIRTVAAWRTDAVEPEQPGSDGGGAELKRENGLVWCSYATYRDDISKPDQRTLHNEFELKKSLYPPLVFRRVPEFHSVAVEPLT